MEAVRGMAEQMQQSSQHIIKTLDEVLRHLRTGELSLNEAFSRCFPLQILIGPFKILNTYVKPHSAYYL